MGLGLNSMEGREAKHIAISRYSHNTAYLHQREQIFRHEYISLIWLREKGYNTNIAVSSSRKLRYIPKSVSQTQDFCNCGLYVKEDGLCCFCNHTLRDKIKVSIENCKIDL